MIKLSRDLTEKMRFFIDEFIPPIIRDNRLFMSLLLKLVFKNQAGIFLDFKKTAFQLSKKEFTGIYKTINSEDWRETDLNQGCLKAILANIKGQTVLEVGCGKGYLACKIAEKYSVTASDIVIEKKLRNIRSNIKFKVADIENLPFEDRTFDTVVSTHTLEHVQNIQRAISELRRVAGKRLMVVVPKQKPYRYTFDLHLHFFPKPFSLITAMGGKQNSYCKEVGHDLFYSEDIK